MTTSLESLPLTETVAPTDQAGVAEILREAHETGTPVYPIGGATSLDFGLPARAPGLGLSLASLDRVVDYPARDMTITVEAGVTLAQLAEALAAEGQRLPVDPPEAEQATLGGVVATNFSGPRRYGFGTIRDYVIGITAVDGRGVPFHGGGRVVKNVAGYDFCKLLTGSLGTLGVVTQLTLKLKPLPQRTALLSCEVDDLAQAEPLLTALVTSQTTPTAIELLAGPRWRDSTELPGREDAAAALVVGLEGTEPEVEWMIERLRSEWREQGAGPVRLFADEAAADLWTHLAAFPALPGSPLILKASLPPSRVTEFAALACEIDPACSIQAHAGSGIVLVRFAGFPVEAFSKTLIGRLQPAATHAGGNTIILRATTGEPTRQAIWGPRDESVDVMQSIKNQFDPSGILNPGRFIY